MRFVPNVPDQVFNISQYADPLGLNITTTPNPSTCRHYQGMARVDGPDGTPFFLVTRSGNTPSPPGEIGCDDSPGETRNGHLIGSNDNSNNGALKMIQNGNSSAAVAFIKTSITWLTRAQEDGANVAVPIALLNQIAASLGSA